VGVWNAWLKYNPANAKGRISKTEARLLANWLLSLLGVAIGRNLLRHQMELQAMCAGTLQPFSLAHLSNSASVRPVSIMFTGPSGPFPASP
jgi:hypothetical protein